MQRAASPIPSSHGGKLYDTAKDQIEEGALMEEVLSQMGISPKTPFRFTQSSRSPSIYSLSLEHQQAQSVTSNDWRHYCVHIRVTVGKGRGDQCPPSHALNGSLIVDILQEACPRNQITDAVVLAPKQAVLFFGRHSYREGPFYRIAQDIALSLSGPVSWTGRTAQVKVTIKTMQ